MLNLLGSHNIYFLGYKKSRIGQNIRKFSSNILDILLEFANILSRFPLFSLRENKCHETLAKLALISLLPFLLIACATTASRPHQTLTPAAMSHLEQGKRYFEGGYYRRAMRELLPLACDGVAEAQYAVGYMYYYGYGVAQDTEVGVFWIKRAANQGYQPAVKALADISYNARTKGMYPSMPQQRATLVAT